VSALAKQAGVEQPEAAELSDLKQDVAPECVLDRIEGQWPGVSADRALA